MESYRCTGCCEPYDARDLERDATGGLWCVECAAAVLAAHRIGRHPECVMVGVLEAMERWRTRPALEPVLEVEAWPP